MRDEDEDEIMEIPDEEDDSRPSELAWKLFDRTVNTKVANSRWATRLGERDASLITLFVCLVAGSSIVCCRSTTSVVPTWRTSPDCPGS